MKNLKTVVLILLLSVIFTSCADEKTFNINGQDVVVEPYGWANKDAQKNDSIIYQACVGNVVWSVILIETIVVPIWLTGWEFYEPVRKKITTAQGTR